MASSNRIERGHELYREGRHREALRFYTEALTFAKSMPQKIALHSNRAACFLKLHDFNKAAEECTSVLELDHDHTGALMLRAQTLVTLKEYHSALFDVNRLMELNPSSEVYQNLQARLKTQLALAPIPESEVEEEEEEEEEDHDHDESKETKIEEKQDQDLETEHPVVMDEETNDLKIPTPTNVLPGEQTPQESTEEQDSKGWQAIPKPKGHSNLDYSRWDSVEDDSSDDDEDDDDSQPQYRFRVRTVNVRPVK